MVRFALRRIVTLQLTSALTSPHIRRSLRVRLIVTSAAPVPAHILAQPHFGARARCPPAPRTMYSAATSPRHWQHTTTTTSHANAPLHLYSLRAIGVAAARTHARTHAFLRVCLFGFAFLSLVGVVLGVGARVVARAQFACAATSLHTPLCPLCRVFFFFCWFVWCCRPYRGRGVCEW